MVAVVLYMNVGLDKESQKQVKAYTQELIDITDLLNGRYYLIYQNYATKEQMYKIYKNTDLFIQIKQKYDQKGLFSNKFSEKYNLK
jgi:calcineurin-like phosphoesterase family protein